MRGYHIRVLVHRKQDPNSKVEEFIPEHLFSKLPAQKPKSTQRRAASAETSKNDYRFGFIRIDWMDIEDVGSSSSHIKKNKDPGRGALFVPVEHNMTLILLGPAQATFIPNKRTKTGSTDLPEGVVHLFRDSASILSSEALEATAAASTVSSNADCDGVMVGVLAVPSWMTPSDFLSFVAPASEGMSHIRIIRCVSLKCFTPFIDISSEILRRIVPSWLSNLTPLPKHASFQKHIMANPLITCRFVHSLLRMACLDDAESRKFVTSCMCCQYRYRQTILSLRLFRA